MKLLAAFVIFVSLSSFAETIEVYSWDLFGVRFSSLGGAPTARGRKCNKEDRRVLLKQAEAKALQECRSQEFSNCRAIAEIIIDGTISSQVLIALGLQSPTVCRDADLGMFCASDYGCVARGIATGF